MQRIEQTIRDQASSHADPFEFMFSEEGRGLFAKLGGARLRVAIEQRKAAQK